MYGQISPNHTVPNGEQLNIEETSKMLMIHRTIGSIYINFYSLNPVNYKIFHNRWLTLLELSIIAYLCEFIFNIIKKHKLDLRL